MKITQNVHEKQQIAKSAAETINDEDVIYLDAGYYVRNDSFSARKTDHSSDKFVQHAANLVDLELATIILGGTIKLATMLF